MRKIKLVRALLIAAMFSLSFTVTSCGNDEESQGTEEKEKEQKKDITNVSFQGESFIYDGQPHSLSVTGLPEGVSVTYTGNGQTNVGTYTVTAHFVDSTDKYNVPKDMSALLIIRERELSGITFDGATFTYDGQPHKLEISGELPSEVSVSYTIDGAEGNSATNAGTYNVTAHFSQTGHNYKLPDDITKTLVINPTDADDIQFNDVTVTYDGESHSIAATNVPEGINVSYKIDGFVGNSAKNAGEYSVVAHFESTNPNIVAPSDMEATLKINKKTLVFTMDSLETTYNGSPFSTYINETIPDGINVSYTINGESGNEATNAGTYTVKAYITDTSDNYIVDDVIETTIKINKASYDLSGFVFVSKEFTYDGTEKKLEVSGSVPSGLDYEYKIDGVSGNSAINAGTYHVSLTFSGDFENYNAIDEEDYVRSLIINKATYDISAFKATFKDISLTYDGAEHMLIGNDTLLPNGVTVNYSDNKLTNVGAITAKAKFSGDVNYNDIPDLEAVLTIVQSDVAGLSLKNKEVTYDGNEYSITLDGIDKLPDTVTPNYTINGVAGNSATNAGVYNVVVSFTDTSGNYNIGSLTATLTINKATYDISAYKASFKDLTVTYDGLMHVLKGDDSLLPNGVTVNYSNNKLTNVGKVSAIASFSGDSNYNDIPNLTANLTIIKKDISSLFSFSGKTFSYDGNAHNIEVTKGDGVPSTVSISYSVVNAIKAGEYNVVATITESSGNYTIPSTLSATMKIVKDGAYWDITFDYKNGNKVEMVVKNNTIITDVPKIDDITGYIVDWSYDGLAIISDNIFIPVKTPIDYDIEYVGNVSMSNTNPATYNIETEVVLKDPTTTNDGYVFDAWYLDSEYKTKITKISLGSTENIKLYARFIDLHITSNNVGFIKNTNSYDFVAFVYEDTTLNNTYNVTSSLVIPIGATATLYSDSELTNKVDNVVSLVVGENSFYYVISKDNKSYTYMIVINKHDMKTYKAYVDGSVLYEGIKEVGETINLPDASKNGFKFVGWSLENNSSITVSMPYTINSNIEFYAYFVSASYTITYKLENGTVLFTDTALYSESYSLHAPYINGEYASVKWIIDEVEYDIDYSFNYNYSKNMVITAKMDIASSEYNIDVDSSNNGVITGYNGSKTNITIPNYVLKSGKYYYVNAIGNEAFMNNTSINSVIINDNIESIGLKAFYNTNITFNTYDNGYYLGDNQNNYKWLVGMDVTKTSLVINDNTKNVSFGALYNSHIESITLPFVGKNEEAASTLDGVFGYIFGDTEYDDTLATVQYSEDKKNTTYYIPESLINIILKNLTVLPYGAFYNVSNVESITIPNTITELKADSLRNMKSITSLVIPSSVESIPEGVISGCLGLTDLTLPFIGASANETDFSKKTLFGYVFGTSATGLNANDYVTVKQYAKKTSSSAFSNRIPKSLTNVTILGGKIYYGSFYNCSMINTIKLGDGIVSVVDLNDSANCDIFFKCTSLENLYLPKGFTHFTNSFKNDTSLTNVYFAGDELDWAKFEFSGLTDTNPMAYAKNIYFKNGNVYDLVTSLDLSGLTEIKDYSFYNFKDVTTITLTNTLTIGKYAFYNCSNVLSLNLPNGLTSIGSYALSNMSGLTSLVIPNTVNTLELGMLAGDGALEEITLPRIGSSSETLASEKTLFGYIFGKTSYTGALPIEQNIDSETKVTFYIPENLSVVHVTNSNSILFYGAFHNCTMIKEIYLEGNLEHIAPRSLAGLSLDKLYLPNTISTIYGLAFYRSSATNIYYEGNLNDWLDINFIAPSTSGDLTTGSNPKCITDNLYFKINGSYQKLTSPLTIPDGTISIGNNQFEGMAFDIIILPSSIETIGSNAFDIVNAHYILYYGDDFNDINSSQEIPEALIYYYVDCVHDANEFTVKSGNIITAPDLTDWEIVTEAGCETPGLRRRKCNVCGEIIEEVIEPLGHNYGDWIVTKEASCTEIGKRQRHCLTCGEYEYEDIPIEPHSYDEGGVCTSCGHSIEYYEITNSINISFDSTNHELLFTENQDSYSIEISALSTIKIEFDYAFDNEPTDSSLEVLVDSETEFDTSNPETDYIGTYSINVSSGNTVTIVFNKGTDGAALSVTNFHIKYVS